jgi:hypothetical protein
MRELANDLSRQMRTETRIENGEIILSHKGVEVCIADDAESGRITIRSELAPFSERDRLAAARASVALNERHSFETATTVGMPMGADAPILGRSFEPDRMDGAELLREIDNFVGRVRDLQPTFIAEFEAAARELAEAAACVGIPNQDLMKM